MPFDPLSDGVLADPYPSYMTLREAHPLVPLAGGGYMLSRAADVEAAFTDRRLGNAPSRFSVLADRNRDRSTAADLAANIPPFQDMPRHAEVRRPLSAAFHRSFAGTDLWLPDMACEALVHAGTRFDVVSDFAGPFATSAMARFLGLPDDPADLRRTTNALFRLFAPITSREILAEVDEDLATARMAIDQTVAKGAHDGSLIARLLDDGTLSRRVIADNVILILADGIENIEAGIALTLLALDRFPEVRESWISGTVPTDAIVAEALRLDSPAQIIPRIVQSDYEREGTALRSGTPVFLCLASANRDPSVFTSPDRFDPTRDDPGRFVFGRGRHSCIGAPLGRALIIAALDAMRAKPFKIDPKPPGFHARFGHRWPKSLGVSLV